MVFDYSESAKSKGGFIQASNGFGSTEPVVVLTLPDGVDPKTVVDMDWKEVIPNENNVS